MKEKNLIIYHHTKTANNKTCRTEHVVLFCGLAWLSYCLIIISSPSSSSSSLFYTIPSSLSLKYIKIVEIISFKFRETHNTTQHKRHYIYTFNFSTLTCIYQIQRFLSCFRFGFWDFHFRESLCFIGRQDEI